MEKKQLIFSHFAPRMFAKFLIPLAVTVLFLSLGLERRSESMTNVLSDYSVYREALREAAISVLPALKSTRNALVDPAQWTEVWRGYRPSKIDKFKDMTFNSPLVPLEDLSLNERFLLLGYDPEFSRAMPEYFPRTLARIAYGYYRRNGKNPVDLLWMGNPQLVTPEILARHLSNLISPVTDKLIEIDHENFSPGNAYVRVITEEELHELVMLSPDVDEWWNYAVFSHGLNDPKDIRTTLTGKPVLVDPQTTSTGNHEPYLVYVKLYGEKGTLFEGLL